MALRFSGSGLAVEEGARNVALAGFLDHALRGVGQVMFQNNSYSGLIFLLAIAWNAPLLAVATLLGALVGTAAALGLGQDRALIRQGLFGYNGALVAVALPIFLRPEAGLWLFLPMAAAASVIVQMALLRLCDVWRVPVLTAPFVLTGWCVMLAAAGLARLVPSGAGPVAAFPAAAAVPGAVGPGTLTDGLFNGIAQVFLQESPMTGLLIVLGLLVASRAAALTALAGSLLALLAAAGLGAAEPALRAGLWGFNGALVAIALGATFWPARPVAWILAALAVAATPVLQAGLSAALAPVGLPALTFPFILMTWLFLLAGQLVPALKGGD